MKKLFFLICVTATLISSAQKQIIVDADTGNEVDDLYALVRILLEPSIKVTALNAAHWQTSHWSIENSMENSHRLNQQLLGEMDLQIPTYRGASARMYDWGDRAQHSAAAYNIINEAEKGHLTILALGALTNVGSAVFIKPEIAKNITVYWLGTTVDFEKEIVKRNDFNPLMDPFALDYLLESEVELNIIPVSVASAMKIGFDVMDSKIGSHFLGKHLQKRWVDHIDGERRSRTLWDLALISVFINPDFGETVKIKTSRDSGNRVVTFYKSIDADAIYQDFYETLLAFERE
ncbi:nucleoside hydrolase [Croceivirga thetidis]|uniref:Nucleoside hydrolase n=1 Tax=Croceivirga thetidis TaxID=2721623 RepID=A0ABX1GR44_9FLAO|nr:nucleoside hydrolase [Croceivirga thetidis]NKI32422.1 nucleoside hydrolase [Croceivirga thetidis]